MSDISERLKQDFRDPEIRRIYCDEFLNAIIATQIKVLREQRGLTQAGLAELLWNMPASHIAALEDVNRSQWNTEELRRIAAALDLTLTVRFDSFGSKLQEIMAYGREALELPSFDDDPFFEEQDHE